MKRLILCLVLLLTFSVNVQAEPEALTVERAVNRVFETSKEMLDNRSNITQKQAEIESIKRQMSAADDISKYLSLSAQLMAAETSYSILYDNGKEQREKMVMSVTRYFVAVINTEKSLELYDASLKLEEKNLAIAKTKNSLGLLSNSDYTAAKTKYDKMLAERKTREVAIDNAYLSLNNLLSLGSKERPRLVVDLKYSPMEKKDAELYVNAADIEEYSGVKNKESNLDVAEYNLAMYDPELSSESKESLQLKAEQAGRDVNDAREQLRSKVRSTFNSNKDIEVSLSTNTLELENLKSQLKIKEKQLELGKIIPLELERHKYSISQLENEIRRLQWEHAINMMILKKPYL